MQYVILDCGGFKQIVSVEKVRTIRELRDNFRDSTLEGNEDGSLKILTGEDVAGIVRGHVKEDNNEDLFTQNIKPTKRVNR